MGTFTNSEDPDESRIMENFIVRYGKAKQIF